MRKTALFGGLSAITLALAVAVTNPADAQQQYYGDGWYGRGMMMGPGMMSGMMPMMGMMDPSQHISGRLAFLKAELRITEAQAPQWNAFADALRANAKRMGDSMNTMMSSGMMGRGMMGQGMMGQGMMMPGQPGGSVSLPDRLGIAEQHMAAHLESLRAMKAPTTQLYAVLSDEQKRLADSLLHSPMGVMGMMWWE